MSLVLEKEVQGETQLPTLSHFEKMHEFIAGRTISAAIYVAAKLKIADELANGPLDCMTLADRLGVQPERLYRLMRALAGEGVFYEREDRFFSLEPLGKTLCIGPGSMRDLILMCGSPWHWQLWGGLSYTIQTGEPYFEDHFGEHFFTYIKKHEDIRKEFNAAMTSLSCISNRIISENVNFTEAKIVVDVGGGHGGLLLSIMQNNVHLHGILFDLPDTIAEVNNELIPTQIKERLQLTGGDFFKKVPRNADYYIVKHVFHGLDTDQCQSVLENIRKSGSEGFTLLIVELVIPDRNESSYSKFNDLGMMLMSKTGRERTKTELVSLLDSSGFTVVSITPSVFGLSLIEAKLIPAG